MDHREAGEYWNDTAEVIAAHPDLQDAQVVSYFLHLRVRKPA
jgi:hypothetical protein